jgi:hypothetical protein
VLGLHRKRHRVPGDDYLIALAAAERAMLVSGDKHLLALAEQLPILPPTRFLELVDDVAEPDRRGTDIMRYLSLRPPWGFEALRT